MGCTGGSRPHAATSEDLAWEADALPTELLPLGRAESSSPPEKSRVLADRQPEVGARQRHAPDGATQLDDGRQGVAGRIDAADLLMRLERDGLLTPASVPRPAARPARSTERSAPAAKGGVSDLVRRLRR